jgi:ubiquinol-cytochrome c reductase iron-sulfur subunit
VSDEEGRQRRRTFLRNAAELDGVRLETYADRWPVAGTRAERRARHRTLAWFGLAVLGALSFVAVYLAWPWRYVPPLGHDTAGYHLYTPLLGLTFGLALLGVSFGIVTYAHNFLPKENAIQERHDEPSPRTDQDATAAILHEARENAGLTRRSWMARALGAGAGAVGLGAGIGAVGSFVKDPWDQPSSPQSLWRTAWASPTGEAVYLRRVTGQADEVHLVRPEDLTPGGLLVCVPFRESERHDPDKLHEALRRADSPLNLICLPPDTQVSSRPGQDGFNWQNYYAYSRTCTHLGCPVGMYLAEEHRLMCPCHSSQFDLQSGARPIFGPAVRPLPQLPITVDETGNFRARGDFTEPIGPSFWELS